MSDEPTKVEATIVEKTPSKDQEEIQQETKDDGAAIATQTEADIAEKETNEVSPPNDPAPTSDSIVVEQAEDDDAEQPSDEKAEKIEKPIADEIHVDSKVDNSEDEVSDEEEEEPVKKPKRKVAESDDEEPASKKANENGLEEEADE